MRDERNRETEKGVGRGIRGQMRGRQSKKRETGTNDRERNEDKCNDKDTGTNKRVRKGESCNKRDTEINDRERNGDRCKERDTGTNEREIEGNRCNERDTGTSATEEESERGSTGNRIKHGLSFHTVQAVRFPIKTLESPPGPG